MGFPTSTKDLLLPKSLRLDANLHAEVETMWGQFRAISCNDPVFEWPDKRLHDYIAFTNQMLARTLLILSCCLSKIL